MIKGVWIMKFLQLNAQQKGILTYLLLKKLIKFLFYPPISFCLYPLSRPHPLSLHLLNPIANPTQTSVLSQYPCYHKSQRVNSRLLSFLITPETSNETSFHLSSSFSSSSSSSMPSSSFPSSSSSSSSTSSFSSPYFFFFYGRRYHSMPETSQEEHENASFSYSKNQ